MPVVSRSNHAFMFDGVTDSIIVPQGAMSRLGEATTQGTKSVGNILGGDNQVGSHGNLSGAFNSKLCIEAWVVPDCGGVVVEKEGQFRLKVGDVDTPGPAVFEVYLNSDSGTVIETLSTAKPVTNRGYEGTVYPPADFRGIHDSYNRYDGSSDDATSLNIDHRPLIHIVATVRSNSIDLYVNGVIMAQKSLLDRNVAIAKYDSHLYIGGKGGKFRGVMEALHISSDFSEDAIDRSAPLKNDNTLLLYRFEEPIAPISGTYKFSAIANNSTTIDGSAVTISQITIPTADAIDLAKKLTGLSTVSGNYIFYKDPYEVHNYSSGDYKVVDYQQSTGTPVTHSISHTPYNLLINAGGIDLDTHKPNGKPIERVRLHNINTSTGTMLVSSIHLDFPNSSNGLRSALHTRTTGVDNHFVVIGSDLLIDNATGKPYQSPHFSTQIIDRTGQMVIDESMFAHHGFVYSSNMATTTDDSDNPFAAVWPATVDTSFQIGHSGRHILNHVDGHEFLRMLPRANEEIIDQRIDGSADLIDIMYDVGRRGAGEQISVNSRVDIFREQDVFRVGNVVNSSRCEALFNNGLTNENKELLAIGGVNFDYKAFMLKGPVPNNLDNINTETRRHHLRPSEESRVAILHVPALSTYDLAPFVKVHYNAIDLTGASMSGTAQPLLMVEKTVPAGTTVVTGTTTVYELIESAVTDASITAILYAPGGYMDARFKGQQLVGNLIQPHSLVGDTSEGYEADDELDESLTPINYKPLTPTGIIVDGNQNAGGGNTITTAGDTTGNVNIAVDDALYTSSLVFVGIIASIGNDITLDENRATALINGDELYVGVLTNIIPNTTPQIITASHSPSTSHDSVFHRIVIDTFHGDKSQTLTDKGEFHRREPSIVLDSPSNGEFDKGPTSSNTHIHEMFDIIDNDIISNNKEGMRLFIQPSDRRRVNQLAKIRSSISDGEEANFVSLMYLMSRARVRSVKESDREGDNFTSVHCVGLSESTANRNVSVRGKGSPDSHVVKEIEPNAPVVTVTLGGPGQGAMDTKPTFDPSPLARLPFSTRRNCATLGYRITTATGGGKIYANPLNNEATDLASWGTYGFPKKGRVYLEDGSNALYDSKDGISFAFTDSSAMGDGKFLLANGTEYQKFHEWLEATDVAPGIGASNSGSTFTDATCDYNNDPTITMDNTSKLKIDMKVTGTGIPTGATVSSITNSTTFELSAATTGGAVSNGALAFIDGAYSATVLFNDEFFDESSLAEDGTTVNDRMFQSMSDVQHDYQLGTQYASTRALVEIPFFANQFFDEPDKGILPGPDNSFKIHVDATQTAHTYNPSPVGRRHKGVEPADREASSSFTMNKAEKKFTQITRINRFNRNIPSGGYKLYPDNIALFPAPSGDSNYQNVSGVKNYRKVFLANGEWAYYESVSTYLDIPGNGKWAYSSGFIDSAIVGAAISPGGPSLSEALIPIGSDSVTPSSDFENRGEYYHDAASVKTQGGNVDYGVRQYVSAVEFKSGPESNPHAPRIKTGRARGIVRNAEEFDLGDSEPVTNDKIYMKQLTVTMDDEAVALFPDLGYHNLYEASSVEHGEFMYMAQTVDSGGTTHNLQYYGKVKTDLRGREVDDNTLIFAYEGTDTNTPSWVTNLKGQEIYLAKRVRNISDSDRGVGETGPSANEMRAQTYKPVINSDDEWTIKSTAGSTSVELHNAGMTDNGTIDNGRLVGSNTFGLNIKPGDVLYAEVQLAVSSGTQVNEVSGVTAGTSVVTVEGVNANTSLEVGDVLYTVAGYTGAVGYSGSRIGTVTEIHSTGLIIIVKKENGTNGIEVNLANDAMLYTGTEIRKIGTVGEVDGGYSSGNDYGVTLENNALFTINEASGGCGTGGRLRLGIESAFTEDEDATLNATWNYPYAPGGLRSGDTIWANMSMNNPHSIEGLFSKSRGVFNESQVWTGFNGGNGALATRPRDSIPLENFLIGDTCLETAQNYAQHVNKTVEENYKALGLTASQAPKVAYVDPYLSEDEHARVLLYDVAHDREFIAFQDLHMQVQTNADAVKIGWPREMVLGGGTTITDIAEYTATLNAGGPSWLTTQIDVANGFPSENPYIRSAQQSKFIESAYAHDTANRLSINTLNLLNSSSLPDDSTPDGSLPTGASSSLSPGIYGKAHGHHIHSGYSIYGTAQGFSSGDSVLPRTNNNTINPLIANSDHSFSRIKRSISKSFITSLIRSRTDNGSGYTLRDPSTFFDTPDGTRVIPAFLCLKGERANALDLTSHSESRLQHLKQWTNMDFVRRLTVDCGSVAQKDGVVSVESAAMEIVRQINQAGAPKGQIVVDKDTTGSAHDPTAWWDSDKAFTTRDRGTHMGYVRAHMGREVQDKNGNVGFTVVIHSTVPGASGRNFCVWLDNSKGQSVYQPEFLIGHGGRWRNFWALPEEKEGENMHPAPMPLNKHGRPFAPVTTLTQYVTPEDSGEDVLSTTDFVNFDDDESPVIRAISNALGGGSQFNSVNTESFETEGSSSVLVEGLRVGKRAIGRVNFGGLVASGIPGWAPDAGVWGFGKKGSQKFRGRYGSLTDVSYTNHTNPSDLKSDIVGNSSLYGLQFEDHRGGKHGLRFIYRTMGESFANENTTLPDTISNEVCVFIDDRDVGLGGFTIGKHMSGSGDASGRFDETNATLLPQSYCGNKWRGISAPSIAVHCTSGKSSDSTYLTVTLEDPFDSADSLAHHDILGYLGFPLKNGVVQISKPTSGGKSGMTFSYTHRTQADKSGTHTFFGIKGSQNGDSFSNDYLISPLLNWTTIVTDELLAAITNAAINAEGSSINSLEGLTFDCREMYATDGRTFGEWGVSENAIKIRAYDTTKPVKPLSTFFDASVHRDMGIQAAHIEFGEVEKTENTSTGWIFGTSRAIADTWIEQQKTIACGYIPNTVLQIITRGKGPNTNTATPLLVDSFNNPVDTREWGRNLKGENFTRHSGDHILPMINNPIAEYDNTTGDVNNWDGTTKELPVNEMWNFLIPAGEEGNNLRVPSFGEEKTIYMSDKRHIVVESLNGGNSKTRLLWYVNGRSEDWPTSDVDDTLAFSHFGDIKRTMEFNGLRSLGSVFSEPIVHFKGGKGGVDHSVPLFFGGGFSGVTLDINDGTMNDYSTFYTHPYANGPTGTSGIQNANEISTSFALMDCNAMFAFFPGAALCNQHRGSILPPFFNKDNILSPDLSKTGTTINTGHPNSGNSSPYNHTTASLRVRVQKPSPLILRFAHPTARYEDHKNSSGTSNVENKTTYIVFGPGQAFPFTQEIADSANMTGANTEQPHPGAVVTIGNTWSKVPVSGTVKLPNHIQNYDGFYMPESSTYQLARGRFHWRSTINWEPPQGKPNVAILKQGPESGRMYGTHFNADTATSGINDELDRAHPMRHCSVIGHGVAMAADMVFHMDGGYHPGGHWMDNQITFNPPHPKSNTILQKCGIIDATCDYNNDPTITMDNTANLFVGMGVSGTGIPIGATVSSITDSTTFELSASTTGGSVTNGTLTFTSPQLHSSAYRVAGPITTKVLGYAAAEGDLVGADVDMEYIIVDATRCQNGEELATVMGMAINTYPGAGALKAMGGTHMPSMGNSMRQDRYGWVETVCTGILNLNSANHPKTNHITVEMNGYTTDNAANRAHLEQIPACGWLRTAAGGFAPYYAKEVVVASGLKVGFYIAPNRISGTMKFEDKTTWYDTDGTISDFPTISANDVIHVWSKAGVHRYNNEVAATRDHMCQTHFSGVIDAIDRTRPTGVAGWAGERYSYLNSLKVGTEGYSGGLGAWHPMLGFSPYGSASSAMTSFGNLPVVAPMPRSPESLPPVDGIGNNLMTYMNDVYNSSTGFTLEADNIATYTQKTSDNDGPDTLYTKPPNYVEEAALPDFMTHPQGVLGRAFLVVSYECESALIAKYDRDGITALGDWLQVKGAAANSVSNPIHYAGTTRWDERLHGQDRFIAPAHAGPNVEALVHKTPTVPSPDLSATHGADAAPFNAEYFLHGAAATNTTVENAIPGLHKTGDMLFDIDHSIGSFFLEDSGVTRNVADDFYENVDYTTEYDDGSTLRVNDFWAGDVNAYALYDRAPAKNFTVEQIVWKRMDGGNLSLPAINARGLGAVPWMTRVNSSGNAYMTGEKIFGNVRFSFETTNSAMLPILQAQEIAHPQLASKNPLLIGNVLNIPNEEIQFEEITVIDDSGQEHTIEGGSPFGTIIRGFSKVTDREAKGMAPSLANSGVAPNLKIQLPDPNSIPGNIIVRSGFDRLQGYQNETMGSGGMMHADLNEDYLGNLFDNSVSGPRKGPTYEDHNWEHIDPLTKDSTTAGWKETTDNAPLRTSYEQHDRTLYFHVTKMGHSHTHRYPTVYTHANGIVNDVVSVTGWNADTNILSINATLDASVFDAKFGTEESDDRKFLRVYNPITDEGAVCSYTDETDATIPVVGDVDFATFMASQTITNLKVVPSYYIPAGSNRFFASRRLRDHAEVSGNSPDMAKTQYSTGTYGTINTDTLAYNIYNKAVITPMPLPRMGHHFVTPTMPMLPGHWAHPAYQGLYRNHLAENASLRGSADRILLKENVTAITEKSDIVAGVSDYFHLQDAEIAFGSLNAAPSGPSDIHGGAFTLMFESKLKNDGYGVLASTGTAGKINQQGGHTVILEAAGNYTLDDFFPDPARVGAYQIVIQPNTFSNQLIGYHVDGGSYSLTGQQVNTVIGRKPATAADGSHSGTSGTGAVALLLAQATQADVRGCEIFINEVMLDINPDCGEQFTNIPPLLLYNPFGVEGTESPAFTRRTLPYHPKLFSNSTPGYTLNIPWWSIVHKVAPDDSTSNNFKHLTHHRLDNYYMMKRSTFGSIGSQLTIAGYPSKYPAIYSHVLQNTSINPKCIVKTIHAEDSGTREITVDDASAFPETPQYGQLLEYTDVDGNIQTLPYTRRYGLQTGTINEPKKFTSTTVSGPFWTKLTTETTLRLTHPYNNLSAGKVMTDTDNSIFTMILPQVEKGTRDTTALHIPDAYLCLWHYNLGRPHTFYSDSSRTWGNLTSDRAVDKKPYNSMPEHFETIHYQDSVYAMSLGPFDFRIKSPKSDTKDGVASTGAEIHALNGYEAQGGTNFDSQKIMFSKFWPCGSRGGPLTSRLDLYTQASISWDIPRKYASSDFYFWHDEDGLDENYVRAHSGISFTAMNSTYNGSGSLDSRKYPYGWRIAIRQACNKPTWGILTGRGKLEDDASSDNNFTVDYASGPLVQHEAMTWSYGGGDGSQSNVSYTTTYVGVMERQTNFAGMLGCDKPEWQVKYSEGRRMTRPFGTPIRTLISNSNMNKDWWGEVSGKGIYSLAEAAQYYLVDWWGNERGEDVRRAPVRGFGIRPAWDCGDAYEYDRANNRTPHARIWNYGKPIYEVLTGISGAVIDSSGNLDNEPPILCGRSNAINNADSNTMVDVFAPTHSMRIGDMGNGRGVRYPIQFNEDILTELSEPIHTTGLVLSSNTAEPPAVTGLLRPRNDVLQTDEIPRGISARLGVSEHGLLKPDAVVSDRVEEISGTSPHKDAVSRNSPRIGIDGHNIENVEKDHIAINTEAHSLHTDRNVGQRTILHGCLIGGSQSLGHLDLTSLAFNAQPRSALRFSHTSNMSPLGGNYILETKNYGNPFDDTGWGYDGLAGAAKTTNPYQNVDFNRNTIKNNQSDKSIKWLLRPVRLLDKNHVEMFRPLPATTSGTPQYNNTSNKGTNTPTDYFRASVGGKYGIYTYEVTTPRVVSNNFPSSTAPDTNGPYVPVFYMSSGSSTITPTSQGPKILGTEMSDFDKTTIISPVTRLVMSENTLQHYRSDAPRRRQISENKSEIRRLDFSVKPRFSQALHPKGHKGDVTFNVSDHSGDAA